MVILPAGLPSGLWQGYRRAGRPPPHCLSAAGDGRWARKGGHQKNPSLPSFLWCEKRHGGFEQKGSEGNEERIKPPMAQMVADVCNYL